MDNQNTFSFKWGSQQSHILEGLRTLSVGETSNVFLTDITLACEGEYIEAHRLVLSLSSCFFKELFNQNEKISEKANGIVILGHVSAKDLRYILQYMYQGAVDVPQGEIENFLDAGRMLKVEGLVGATTVRVGLLDKFSQPRNCGPSTSASCPKSKKPQQNLNIDSSSSVNTSRPSFTENPSVSTCSGAGDKINKPSHPIPQKIKSESYESSVLAATFSVEADDDGGVQDSDFDEGACGTLVDEDEALPLSAVNQKRARGRLSKNPELRSKLPKPKSQTFYYSSSDDDSSDGSSSSTVDYFDAPPNKIKRQRMVHNWVLQQSFPTFEEARLHVKSQKRWTLRNTHALAEGSKVCLYDCKDSRYCPLKLRLREKEDPPEVELYLTDQGHNHEEMKKIGLSEETKQKINQLWASGVKKPKRVMDILKKEGIEPKLSQIVSYMQYNIRSKINAAKVVK